MTFSKTRVSSIQVGNIIDTNAGPATVLEIGHDRYSRSAINFTLEVGGREIQVGSFRGGQTLNVAR